MSSELRTFCVSGWASRLDRWLAGELEELSRAQVQRLIAAGEVLVNGELARAAAQLAPGDVVVVRMPTRQEPGLYPEALPLRVVYEDEHLLAIDKPAGLVVHPGVGHAGGTLVNALLAYRPDVIAADLDPARPGIVHRLDRDTTGLLLVAATRRAQEALQAAFKQRDVQKTYLALVAGKLAPERAAIEAPIGRDPTHRRRMAVLREGGREARTEYRVRERLPRATLVEADLLTGRTHQLRVHFSAIGHPVVGDRVYGPRRPPVEAPRQMLHAWRLVLRHPITGEELRLESAVPDDLEQLCARLRAGYYSA